MQKRHSHIIIYSVLIWRRIIPDSIEGSFEQERCVARILGDGLSDLMEGGRRSRGPDTLEQVI